MGIFSESECRHCSSKDHASDNCPHDHGIFGLGEETECRHCSSNNHASDDCPHDHGLFSSWRDSDQSPGNSSLSDCRSDHLGASGSIRSNGGSGGGYGSVVFTIFVIGGVVAAAYCYLPTASTMSGHQNSANSSLQSNYLPGERYSQTRTGLMSAADVRSLTAAQLRYAINEMFARHGASFPQPELRKQFRQFGWYHPRPGLSFDQVEAEFSNIEKTNLKLLAAIRDARKGR